MLLFFCVAPTAVGSAYLAPPAPRLQHTPNPVGMLFVALSRCRAELPERERWRIAGVIHHESQRYGYDPLFVLAIVEVESTCLPTARSRQGAVGLIQLKPSIARAVAEEAGVRWQGTKMLIRPAFNVHLGLGYLSQLEKRFRDSHLALAAYNLGPKRVARMPHHRARRTEYVRKVLSRYEALLAQNRVPATHRADATGSLLRTAASPEQDAG